uniref:(California timema) hypothetical protein n=1 Tax=Timema californicum TaxID=61474 RepID=A0A7R9J4N9_TIMCA|nr:unnamed protein product [Timema californicum]
MSTSKSVRRATPPLALQTLDHSDLYARRVAHYSASQASLIEKEDLCDYEDLSSGLADISWASGSTEEERPPLPPKARSLSGSVSTSHVNSVNMSLGNMFCSRCGDGFEPHEKIVNSNGELWHTQCFVCAQCFRPFPEGIFYEFEGRKYCEHDFQVLFAPCCGKCGEFVIGRVIKAMNANWHPNCFRCEECNKELADLGFIRNQGRALCHECNAKAKAVGLGKYVCHKCHGLIDDKPLRFRGEVYHPYHFNCTACGIELNADAREVRSRPGFAANEMAADCWTKMANEKQVSMASEQTHAAAEEIVTLTSSSVSTLCAKLTRRDDVWCVDSGATTHMCRDKNSFLELTPTISQKNELYCLRCHDKMGIPICGACRRPIEERVVTALGKHWHVEHFVCAKCEKPFLGHRHYEKKGLAYCETHYHQLFGNLCFVCNQVIGGDVFTALNKAWCVHHFACSVCDLKMNQKTKFYEFDLKPVCKKCYEKFPMELRRRLRRAHEQVPKKLPA